MHFLQAINSDISVLIVCNKTRGTMKGDIKNLLLRSGLLPHTVLIKVMRKPEKLLWSCIGRVQTHVLIARCFHCPSYCSLLGRDVVCRLKEKLDTSLTFVGPCILIYFYSKTNQMHNISNLFYFGTPLNMFRRVSPSIITSLRLYIQHQVYVIQVLWLPLASSHRTCMVWCCMYSLRLLMMDGETVRNM
jgi:hypothetical protein